MKTRFAIVPLLSLLVVSTGFAAEKKPSKPAADTLPELTITIVESLGGSRRYNDLDRVFTAVFEERKWPVTIAVERFAANTAPHDIELRIFFQSIGPEAPGEVTFRAWMTLTDHAAKHDFGIIKFRSHPRALQQEQDIIDNVIRGAALIAADKIEAVLFPKPTVPKP